MPDSSGAGGFGPRTGVVASFDEHAGTGRVVSDDGAWLFHCTTIADGTRTISVDAEVSFRIGPGGPGVWEAFEVELASAHDAVS